MNKIAIVNRGEPAVRFLRALYEYNDEHGTVIESVALFTDEDEHALFVRLATQSIALGPAMRSRTDDSMVSAYCDHEYILDLLQNNGCDAVWPGWGFVSEDYEFVEKCEDRGITFIGPSSAAMKALGDKIASKYLAESCKVPMADWIEITEGMSEERLRQEANRIGFPLMIKASAGGGGRGIRKVKHQDELLELVSTVKDEVAKVFGQGGIFMEACIVNARHIEIQAVADSHGNSYALGVRDCSIQRKNQKIIEETPSPILPPDIESRLCDVSAELVRKANYVGVGTVEFLYQPSTQVCSFLEVNSRLQVEHTITEMVTDSDLVKAQIDIACGKPFSPPKHLKNGHAIELRLNAENPEKNFQPSPGKIEMLNFPSGPGIRIDSGVMQGMEISPCFDSMIAKLIVWAPTRKQAISRAKRACDELDVLIEDGSTNQSFLSTLLRHPAFIDGTATTSWLDEEMLNASSFPPQLEFEALLMGAILEYVRLESEKIVLFFDQVQSGIPRVKNNNTGLSLDVKLRDVDWTVTVYRRSLTRWIVEIEDQQHSVDWLLLDEGKGVATINGSDSKVLYSYGTSGVFVEINGTNHLVERSSGGVIRSTSPAVVVSVRVEEGDIVEKGNVVCTIEAMKMEMPVVASESGRVKSVNILVNQQIKVGDVLFELEAVEDVGGETSNAPKSLPEYSPSVLQSLSVNSNANEVLNELNPSSMKVLLQDIMDSVSSIVQGFDYSISELNTIIQILKHPKWLSNVKESSDLDKIFTTLEMFNDVIAVTDRNQFVSSAGESSVPLDMLFAEYCRLQSFENSDELQQFKPFMGKCFGWYGLQEEDDFDAQRIVLYRMFSLKSDHEVQHQITGSVLGLLKFVFEMGFHDVATQSVHDALLIIPRTTRKKHPYLRDFAWQAMYTLFHRDQYGKRETVVANVISQAFSEVRTTPPSDELVRQSMQSLQEDTHALQKALFLHQTQYPTDTHRVLEVLVGRLYSGTPYEWVSDFTHEGCIGLDFSVRTYGSLKASSMKAVWMADESYYDILINQQDSVSADILEIFVDKVSSPENVLTAVQQIPALARRCTVTWFDAQQGVKHHTFLRKSESWVEDVLIQDIHPEVAQRLDLWRLDNFTLERLTSHDRIYAFKGTAKHNTKDRRIFVFAEVFGDSVKDGAPLWEFEKMFFEAVHLLRETQAKESFRTRYRWNTMQFMIHPVMTLNNQQVTNLSESLQPHLRGLSVQDVSIRGQVRKSTNDIPQNVELKINKPGRYSVEIQRIVSPILEKIPEMSDYDLRVLRSKRFNVLYPYEAVKMLVGTSSTDGSLIHPDIGKGTFVEYDLNDQGLFVPVDRVDGLNSCGIVCGLMTNYTNKYPEGMTRMWIASDATRSMGALAEPECKRLIAAFELAESLGCPIEWLPISSGAKIAMDSGTENLDWTALVLKKIVEFTQRGHICNIIVHGINVGAQSYWNAEATMLMHTKGVLIMTFDGSMVLTGKKALDYSGAVSAEDERGVGGAERIMAPNGQAQYVADSLGDAYRILFDWYQMTYRSLDESAPRKRVSTDPVERSIMDFPCMVQGEMQRVSSVFDAIGNAERKKAFHIRDIMKSVIDQDSVYLERFQDLKDGESSVVWDCHLGGWPVSLVGVESTQIKRLGRTPMDGPEQWSGGTLFPVSSKKVARGINSASGNRPLVVLANLSGFDGSPESLRRLQLEYGAEIGRAIVNFKGPIVFVVIGRYHGGAYVVFSKALNDNLRAFAIEGSYASVIGGAPAAAVVFPREVQTRTEKDVRVLNAKGALAQASENETLLFQQRLEEVRKQVQLEKQGEVAKEFDGVHSVERAVKMGSLDGVIAPDNLRVRIVEELNNFDFTQNRFG